MPSPIRVILAPYDPEWPWVAALQADRLQALSSVLVALHHIGSTSVPGLAATPIIDLMPFVDDLTELDRLQGRVEALGYEWHGEEDGIALLMIQRESARFSFTSSRWARRTSSATWH